MDDYYYYYCCDLHVHAWKSYKGYAYKYSCKRSKKVRVSNDYYKSFEWIPKKRDIVSYYNKSLKKKQTAIVMDIHYDNICHYFTIKLLSNGNEKNTELLYLSPITDY